MKSLSVFVATFLFSNMAIAQVEIEWIESTSGVSIAVDGSDNVYTATYEYSPGGDITVTKRDSAGGLLWESAFNQTDPSKWERASWVQTDSHGGVLVCGTLMSGYSNPVTAASILMKFASDGDLLWRNVYESGFDGSYATKCLVDEDDNIYVLGMGSGAPGYVTKVKKFTRDGVAVWTYFDSDGIGRPINFKFVPGNGIVITGRGIIGSVNGYAKIDRDGNRIWGLGGVNSLTVGDADGDEFGNSYLVHGRYETGGGTTIKKVSPSGVLLWSRDYDLAAFRIEVGADNQPVVCGFPTQSTPGASFLKADPDGNVVWTNPNADGPHGLLLHAHMIMDSQDNIYLAAGLLTQMAVCKVASDGTSAWTATTPGSNAFAIALGSDRSVYVIGGATAKLRQDTATTVEPVGHSSPGATCLPNPCVTHATIRYELPQAGYVTLRLYDLNGRSMITLVDGMMSRGAHDATFEVGGLATGVYVYELRSGSDARSGRLTVVR